MTERHIGGSGLTGLDALMMWMGGVIDMRIGIDFGGVLVAAANDDQRFKASQWRVVEGAFEAIAELVTHTHGQIWIVSKADMSTQRLTRQWLAKSGFYPHTGFDPAHLRFCGKRADKRNICIDLGFTHFLDDSEEVVNMLRGNVPHLYLYGGQVGLKGIVAVKDWLDFMQHIKTFH